MDQSYHSQFGARTVLAQRRCYDGFFSTLLVSQEGMSRKINLEKVRESLDTVCTLCGYAIPPQQVLRTGYDRV